VTLVVYVAIRIVNVDISSSLLRMLFALHAPYCKFCTDGRMMVNRPKHVVKIKIKCIVVFD